MAGVPTPIKLMVLLSALENVTLTRSTIQVSYYHYFINLLLLSPLLFCYISQMKCDGSRLQQNAFTRERERERATVKVYCNKNVFKTIQINSVALVCGTVL